MTGKPARMLRTAWTDEWERPDGPGPLPMPMQPILVAPALQRVARVADAAGSGGQQLVTYFVGQVVGAMNTVKPTRRVVLEMVEEFIDAVERLDDLVQSE
jgi:NAD(P)H-dependent flavin oxidoreductase YrpB (nitropropane dioxygenase family)